MFNRKSSYALNKKDPNAIVYIDANDNIISLTRTDFSSEEEFQKWKAWSDENYHTEDNGDVVEDKHNVSINVIPESLLTTPAIDVVLAHRHERAEKRLLASSRVVQIKDKLTDTQFRRLWMYLVDEMTLDEIGAREGVSHQAISLSITATIKKVKKYF